MGGRHWRDVAHSLGKTELDYLSTVVAREHLSDDARTRLHALELEELENTTMRASANRKLEPYYCGPGLPLLNVEGESNISVKRIDDGSKPEPELRPREWALSRYSLGELAAELERRARALPGDADHGPSRAALLLLHAACDAHEASGSPRPMIFTVRLG